MNHENLWAPWRAAYLRELVRKADGLEDTQPNAAPFLIEYWQNLKDDVANHVVFRNEHGMVILNRYPYSNGHLLIALGDPRPTLLEYEPDQRAAFWKLVEIGCDLLQRTLSPQGINMGINQGRAAGAGIPEHLHAHLVPRWSGDTNFMTVVGDIRVIPDSLEKMAEMFRKAACENR
ncbi:MAG: HIT domain-containing protein [Planctomycetes bacterium]|nr:HIT domain-containing protein [Planctomycetota bacterium]